MQYPNNQVANDPGKEESEWHETYRVLSLDAAAPGFEQSRLEGSLAQLRFATNLDFILVGLVWGRSDPLRWELQAWSNCLWVGPPQVRAWDSLSFMKIWYWHILTLYWHILTLWFQFLSPMFVEVLGTGTGFTSRISWRTCTAHPTTIWRATRRPDDIRMASCFLQLLTWWICRNSGNLQSNGPKKQRKTGGAIQMLPCFIYIHPYLSSVQNYIRG